MLLLEERAKETGNDKLVYVIRRIILDFMIGDDKDISDEIVKTTEDILADKCKPIVIIKVQYD